MATEEWIQESLARLESLEEERKKHEDALETNSDPSTLRMHTQAIDRLEVKIRALYAELEAVAAADGEDADGGEDTGGEDISEDVEDEAQGFTAAPASTPEAPAAPPFAAAPAAPPFGGAPAASPLAAAPAAPPFGGAPAASPLAAAPAAPPFGGAPAASPFGDAPASSGFSSTPESLSTFDDSDSDGGGGGSKVGIIVVLVLALGGAGAYFAFGRTPAEEEAPPAAPTEIKVIKSGEIPPDTQGPRAAKGGNLDATHGAHIKETERRTGGGGGGGGGSSASSNAPKKKKEDKATKIEKTDDPLGGIR